MRLIDIVPEGAIAAPIKALEREAIIPELVDLVIASGGADAASRDDLIARVLDRERILSTGFGRGVAVPHAKHASIRQIVAAVGVS
ncbi:MAG: PTS sugar transporter subunit IIA, partial [Planctomycetota bacterium]